MTLADWRIKSAQEEGLFILIAAQSNMHKSENLFFQKMI